MKLWQKQGMNTLQRVESFTVGNDREFDMVLAKYDILGTLAHMRMLLETGLLTDADFSAAHRELVLLLSEVENGRFRIDEDCEDIHSQVEMMLTAKIGDAGKKIHTGRSRNDQVAVDIKLYLREEIIAVKKQVARLFALLQSLSERYKEALMPGYTHLQIGMPSSFGLWFGAYAEALTDDLQTLIGAFKLANKNPLGSGAGYGSSLPLNRRRTTELLGFDDLHYNCIYAQMSRGKTERTLSVALAAIAATVSRLSMDICLYSGQDYCFISLPDNYTTGSSIMPHKKNPDVFELVRGKCNRLQSLPNEFALLLANLPSGYHREMQLTKEMLFPAIETLKDCLSIVIDALPEIRVHHNLLESEKYDALFTVEQVNELIHKGVPFREAYRTIAAEVNAGTFRPANRKPLHSHEGSIGNLCTKEIKDCFEALARQIPDEVVFGQELI